MQIKYSRTPIIPTPPITTEDERKSTKAATNKDLEYVVSKWFLQQCTMGMTISVPIVCEKANIITQELGCSSFKASNAWLRYSKFYRGVRELELSSVKLLADSKAAVSFIEKFKVI